jgi:hypothetical protein
MWRMIDKEMDLQHCTIYHYAPDEDPYDGEDGAIWSENYFFFNKVKKRVCYLYFRGLSVLSHSPAARKSVITIKDGNVTLSKPPMGLARRTEVNEAAFTAPNKPEEFAGDWDADEDYYYDMDIMSDEDRWGDDEVDVDDVLDDGDEPVFISLDDYSEIAQHRNTRGFSEEVVGAMELDV